MFFAVCKHFLFLHQPSVFLHFLIIELIVRRDFADIRSSETFQKNDVTEEAVYLCTGNPLPKDIEQIAFWLLNESFSTSFKRNSFWSRS